MLRHTEPPRMRRDVATVLLAIVAIIAAVLYVAYFWRLAR